MSRTVLHVALTLLLPMASTLPASAGPWAEKVVGFSQEAPGATTDQYSAVWTYWKNLGYAPAGLGAVEKTGQPVRYQGLWAKDPTILDWASKRNLTDSEYQQAWEQLTGAGYRVLDLDAHAAGARRVSTPSSCANRPPSRSSRTDSHLVAARRQGCRVQGAGLPADQAQRLPVERSPALHRGVGEGLVG